jgi:phospholipase/lecithinase/hemolysin
LKKLSQACIDGYEECITWVKQNYPDVTFTVPILKDVFRGGNDEYFIEADERIEAQKKYDALLSGTSEEEISKDVEEKEKALQALYAAFFN